MAGSGDTESAHPQVDATNLKSLDYFWERFQSDEPYDDDAIRAAWQHEEAERLFADLGLLTERF